MPDPTHRITYQPTVDDHVGAHLTSSMSHIHPWRWMVVRLAFYLGVGGAVVYLYHLQGRAELTRFFAVLTGALAVSAVVSAVRTRRRLEQRLGVMFAKKKNIGLAVPITVALHERYVEIASTLEHTRIAWDVVEEIDHRDGFVLIGYGLSHIFLPERVFESPQACASFVEAARSLHAAALAQPGDPRTSRWGAHEA